MFVKILYRGLPTSIMLTVAALVQFFAIRAFV